MNFVLLLSGISVFSFYFIIIYKVEYSRKKSWKLRCLNFVRGAVSSGFPNYSGKSQNVKIVTNDSEGDERLKNIEPKMVELITNEVRK